MTEGRVCSSCGFPTYSPPGVRCTSRGKHDWPPSPPLRQWAKNEVAPDDATREELALHVALWGDVFVRAPEEKSRND